MLYPTVKRARKGPLHDIIEGRRLVLQARPWLMVLIISPVSARLRRYCGI